MDPEGSDGACPEDSTRDMEPPGPGQDDDTGFLRLEVDEDREEPQETQPVAMSLTADTGDTGDGAAAEAGAEAAPEQDPAAAEVEEEADGEAVGDGDGVGNGDGVGEEADGHGAAECPPPGPGQPGPEGPEGQPQQGGPPPQARRFMFSRLQLRELESLFQRNQYPNVFMR
ncbi:rhox homeobox family member 2-like [Leptonychotes weddellii]|uniref:Rhox homeobox family member 2-like n=1 Tax=Leptonychotes weddellii TaxID=9713 RepID=A0A7F8QD05_LEPWE|nr:rhox homeobox family member 2-like [Leptonychotes weddellii]